MWSWKLIYEDETFNLFCDIDSLVGSEEIEDDDERQRVLDSLKALTQQGIKLKTMNGDVNQRKEVIFALTDMLTLVTAYSS